jgi:lipoprotein-releasing system ATP-binding protein
MRESEVAATTLPSRDAHRDSARGALQVVGVSKRYAGPRQDVVVLDGVDLALGAGEAACITGPSGSGKSTLLHIIGGLEPPSGGCVTLDGVDPYGLGERALARFRNQQIGFVFQDHYLLPQLVVLDNVLLPMLASRPSSSALQAGRARAHQLLASVGLEHRLDHRPAELSGGERQRAAIARALISKPSLLLCDEPTGNLDARTATAVGDLLFDLHAKEGGSLLVVTHSIDLAARFERRFELEGGTCSLR